MGGSRPLRDSEVLIPWFCALLKLPKNVDDHLARENKRENTNGNWK